MSFREQALAMFRAKNAAELQVIDDPCKRTLAEGCSCGAPLFVFIGRHCGRWLLRHERSYVCPFAGTWLYAETREAVVGKWKDMTENSLPF